METIGQLHTPATLPLGTEPPVPTAKEAVWTPELDWMLWRSDNSPVPAGNLNTFSWPTRVHKF